MLYPLIFEPILKEKVWGGRKMAELFGKKLPTKLPIGESWEISDRPGDVSVIKNGPLAGKDLHWLVEHRGSDLMGKPSAAGARFPLLIKVLEAREKLSLQVHPPADKAAALAAEPKTEMWHIVQADAGAELYVGLKRGVTRPDFEARIRSGAVAECFHTVTVKKGDSMFLPSGRVHGIGAGMVLFEIQQNSDSTYRVYDWDRCGLDGKPRALHIPESLACIDFDDFEPPLLCPKTEPQGGASVRTLVDDSLFTVREIELRSGGNWVCTPNRMQVLAVTSGSFRLVSSGFDAVFNPGEFVLIPFSCQTVSLAAENNCAFLSVYSGRMN